MHNFQMNINEYLPLRDVVFYTLRQAILKGELDPGERFRGGEPSLPRLRRRT